MATSKNTNGLCNPKRLNLTYTLRDFPVCQYFFDVFNISKNVDPSCAITINKCIQDYTEANNIADKLGVSRENCLFLDKIQY